MWGIIYWPKYLIACCSLFIIPELIGLFTDARNTLSDYCWNQLHVGLSFGHSGQHSVAWWFSLIAWLLFVVVITGHIWWRTV